MFKVVSYKVCFNFNTHLIVLIFLPEEEKVQTILNLNYDCISGNAALLYEGPGFAILLLSILNQNQTPE